MSGSERTKRPSLEDLDDDVHHLFQRVRDLEQWKENSKDEARETQDNIANVAKLSALTARGLQELQGRSEVVGFLTGGFKQAVATRFTAYQKEAKTERENAKKEGREPVLTSGGWKVEFLRLVAEWVVKQLATLGGGEDGSLHAACELLKSINPVEACANVLMRPTEPPTDHKPWLAIITCLQTPGGAELFKLLTITLKRLWQVKFEQTTTPAELSCKVNFSTKDRPLTAEVAHLGGLRVREGKGQGRGKGQSESSAGSAGRGDRRDGRWAKRQSPPRTADTHRRRR